MNYKIVENKSFTLVGIKDIIATNPNVEIKDSNIKKDAGVVWMENASDIQKMKATKSCQEKGLLSIVHDYNVVRGNYNFILGVNKDDSTSELELNEIELPKHTWAVFESKLTPNDNVGFFLKTLYHKIYTNWFPNSDYELCDKYTFEIWPQSNNSAGEYTFETWMPVKLKK